MYVSETRSLPALISSEMHMVGYKREDQVWQNRKFWEDYFGTRAEKI